MLGQTTTDVQSAASLESIRGVRAQGGGPLRKHGVESKEKGSSRVWPRSHQRAVVLGRVKAEPCGWPLKSGQP